MPTGAKAVANEIEARASSPWSYLSRTAPIAIARPRQAAPIATAPHCQPNARISTGTRAPASAPPAGTPVCLMEKMRENIAAGAARTRITELAGVVRPYPRPTMKPPSSTSGGEALAASARPHRASTRPAWLTRIGPKRATQPPAAAEPIMLPQYVTAM